MICVLTGVLTRIISNSYLNVFQKFLTNKGNKSSVVNFYTYLGLTLISLSLIPFAHLSFNSQIVFNFIIMGLLGAFGNYFIIKALSIGELSSLAPINSYKPVVALIFALFYLKEIPSFTAIFGIFLIVFGTYILHNNISSNKKAVFYRVLALFFSGTEAVFIKKIIVLTNIPASFILWAVSGLIFSSFFVILPKHKFKIHYEKHLILLIFSVALMQYSTNYVFSKMNVSCALALFQLSTLLSVFLGVNIFHEKELKRKIVASIIMIIGAIIIILQ